MNQKDSFIITIKTLKKNTEFYIYFEGECDGLITYENSKTFYISKYTNYVYEIPGIYDIIIKGKVEKILFVVENTYINIIDIKQWGNVICDWEGTFADLVELKEITAKDVPILKNCRRMFDNCTNLKNINNIENWDLSNIEYTSKMFLNCYNFNGNLSNWNMSNVKESLAMFYNCYEFNSDLSNWNVTNLKNVSFMFYNCKNFNSNLSKWHFNNLIQSDNFYYRSNLELENVPTEILLKKI